MLRKITRTISRFDAYSFLVILFIIGIFITLWNYAKPGKQTWIEVSVQTLQYNNQVYNYNPLPLWVGNSLKEGDVETDSFGNKIAILRKIETYEYKDYRQFIRLELSIRVIYDPKLQKYKFKNRPVEISAPIELHLGNTYLTSAVVTHMPDSYPSSTKELKVKIKYQNIFPWEADALTVGDKIKDRSNNYIVAEILEKNVENADKTSYTLSGVAVATKDPLKRDVFLTLKLRVREESGGYYFENYQKIKVGETLTLSFPKIDINDASITAVEE